MIQKEAVDPKKWAVIIVGAGPVGMRTAALLLKGNPDLPVLIYGDEPDAPYQRARLSEFIAGDVPEQAIYYSGDLLKEASVLERRGCAVLRIDPKSKTVTDAAGRVESYVALVLATGSSARRYYTPGISLPGVFTFRNLNDARALLERRKPGRGMVVLGGGALGLESALAMQGGGAAVSLVDHNVRLMSRQLDKRASSLLQAEMTRLGIEFYLSEGIKTIFGVEQVMGVQLWQGQTIDCDTLILATGVQANTSLAKTAGLRIGQGIIVNDYMETSAKQVYAVGECAQHRGMVYRLVAPGLEQAEVAAGAILRRESRFTGSVSATRLKNIRTQVFSMGEVENEESRLLLRNPIYQNSKEGIYRKLILNQGGLRGLIVLGEWPELSRLQEAVKRQNRISIFQVIHFLYTGQVYSDQQSHVLAWPEAAVVCQCLGITRGTLSRLIQGGCTSLEKLAAETGASRMCGGCKPLLADLCGAPFLKRPQPVLKNLLGISIAAAVLVFTVLSFPSIPLSKTVQGAWKLETLWLDGFWKQVTGYHLLGLSILSLLLSAKKRLKFFRLGSFGAWRMVHTIIGLLMLGILVLHTGLSLGSNLNLALMLSFLAATALGTLAGGIAALEGRMNPNFGPVARRWGNKLHIYMSWPLPVLLIFHMMSVYFF